MNHYAPRFGLPKNSRLNHSTQFDRVFNKTDYRLSRVCFLLLATRNDLSHSRLGMVVGRKAAPLAVERSRIKRVIRESFRHISLDSFDIIVLARSLSVAHTKPHLRHTIDNLFTELQTKSREI